MSASRPPLSSRPAFLPDEIARREFATAFRGYEPAEVRTFLSQISEQFAELADRVAELQVAVNEKQSRDEAPELDEETVTRLLGAQTAQILRSAREAANESRAKAEEDVSTQLREAHEVATRMRTEAETFHAEHVGEATTLAKALIEDAQAEAEALRTSAIDEASAIRNEIEDEAQRVRTDIATDIAEHESRMKERFEAELEAARTEGREIVEVARAESAELVNRTNALQEENLNSILRKRSIAVAQVEELRAGRQRLLEAYKMVRSTLDDVTVELEKVESEARSAAGNAGVIAAANSGLAQDDLDAVIELEEYSLNDDVSAEVIDLVEEKATASAPPNQSYNSTTNTQGGGGAFFDQASVSESDTDEAFIKAAAKAVDLTGSRDPENPAVELELDLRDDDEDEDDDEPVIRFPQGNDFLQEERNSGPRLTSSFIIGESSGTDNQDDYRVNMRRNAAVTKNRPQAVRRLRRVLQDEQDALVAQLRSGLVSSPDILLGSVDTQATTYQRSVVRLFREVVRAGASSVEGSTGVEIGAIDHAGNDAARHMSIELVGDLRSQLVPVLEELMAGDTVTDANTLTALIGGPYRVVSGDYLEQLVDDRIGGAFDHGVNFAN